MNKKLLITGMLIIMGISATTTVYAQNTQQGAVAQSNRWDGAGDTWRVKTEDGTGYLSNSWFQDTDSSWYMLGADGVMYSGIVTDLSTGKSYLLNPNHDGTFGRMLTQDGAYNINGTPIYLTFNQSHDGSFGAITSGLDTLRSIGLSESQLPSIPSDSAGFTGSTGSAQQTQPQQSSQPTQSQQQTDNMSDEERHAQEELNDILNSGVSGLYIDHSANQGLDLHN